MITPYLEQLIEEGLATAKSYAGGYGGLYTITCPENRYIILYSISVQLPITLANLGFDVSLKVEGLSHKTNNVFIFRPQGCTFSGGGVIEIMPMEQKRDCYILSPEDLRLRFALLTTFSSQDYISTQPFSKEPNPAAGYGVAPALVQAGFSGSEKYLPISGKYTDPAIVAGGVSTDQPFPAIVVGVNEIPQALSLYGGLLLNCEYVVVNKRYTNKLG